MSMMQNLRSCLSDRWAKIFVVLWTLLLALTYLIFIKRQYSDIFFESQFLHIDFLRDISQHNLTARGFFTTFGEHLFPGYNLVLAANYYLFNLWGGFDSIVYAVSLFITAVIVVGAIYRSSIRSSSFKTLIALIAAFLLLSTTNNPQWGMALSAAIGVTLFVTSAFLLGAALDDNAKQLNPIAYIAIALAILFFLGGYAIGAVAAIFLLLTVWVMHNRIFDFKVIAISGVVFLCLIIYVILINKYGTLLGNKPTGATFSFQLMAQFLLLMTGASLLGKAFLEQTHQLWPYYLIGAILLFWSACLFKEFIQKPSKGRLFVLAIATYSSVNIFTVSLFRYKNGLDGALGQWYNVHTHFIGVAVCYYLLSSLGERKFSIASIAKIISLAIILGFTTAGYYCDWKKSEYVSSWKNQFITQAPVLLAFPDMIPNLIDPMSTMLWNYPQAKAGVEFMYSNNLWLFQKKSPLIFGLTDDGWLENKTPVMIICPNGSKKLSFRAWRPDGKPKSIVTIKRPGSGQDSIAINNSDIQIEFSSSKAAVLIDGSDLEKSRPISSESDPRHLVAIVNNISCEDRAEHITSLVSQTLSPPLELKIHNWGPQSAEVGTIPNKQPDGGMGIWIEVSGTKGLGDAQVIFGGKLAKASSVQTNLVTASIAPELFEKPGVIKIFIKQSKTGKLFPVGIFRVDSKIY